jgi:hypothetical protein
MMNAFRALVVLLVALSFVLALSGCAGAPLPPPEKIVTVTEKVLVPVPCVDVGLIPPAPAHVASSLNGMAAHDLLVVDQSALDLRTWGERLDAMLRACASPPSATPRPDTNGSGSPPR